jgi:tetratricopeptide (TPR) repeat protein
MNRSGLIAVLFFLGLALCAQPEKPREKKPGRSERKARAKAVALLDRVKREADAVTPLYGLASLADGGHHRFLETGKKYAEALARINGAGLYNPIAETAELLQHARVLIAGKSFTAAEMCLRGAEQADSAGRDILAIYQARTRLYAEWGRLQLAGSTNESSLKLLKGREDRREFTAVLNDRALLLRQQADFAGAESVLRKAITIAGRNDDRAAVFALQNNLGVMLVRMNRLREAESALSSAITEGSPVLKNHDWPMVSAQVNLAIVQSLLGRGSQAESLLSSALGVTEKVTKDQGDEAWLKLLLSQALASQEKNEEALNTLRDAVALSEKVWGKSHPVTAAALLQLGNLYRYTGDLGRASDQLQRAQAIARSEPGEESPLYLSITEAQALTEWQKGKHAEATAQFNLLLSPGQFGEPRFLAGRSFLERARYRQEADERLWRIFSCFSKGEVTDTSFLFSFLDAYAASSRKRIDFEMQVVHVAIHAVDDRTKALNSQLAESAGLAGSLFDPALFSPREKRDSAITAAVMLEKERAAQSGAGPNPKTTLAKELMNALSDDEAFVQVFAAREYNQGFTGAEKYHAIVLYRKQPRLVHIGGENEIRAAVDKLLSNIKAHRGDPAPYEALWLPIESELKEVRNIYLSLDGEYRRINPQVMETPGGQLLGEKHLMRQLWTLPAVTEAQVRSAKLRSALVLGDPDYSKTPMVEPMTGADGEVRRLAKMLVMQKVQFTKLLGDNADEGRLRLVKPCELVHVAARMFLLENEKQPGLSRDLATWQAVLPNPLLRAGVLLTDCEDVYSEDHVPSDRVNGVLTAFEIQRLPLTKTRLVVVSGTESAPDHPQPEALGSFARGFFNAGAKKIIFPLWDPGEQAMSLFLNSFYPVYLKTGDENKSFEQAVAVVRKKYKDIATWGAFVLINR